MKPLVAMEVAARCRQIQGWFSFEAALLFAWIDEVQRQMKLSGDLFEIGVHRGRSAVLLSHFLGAGESLAVCDLFGQQADNLSRSGSGDRVQFDANMRRFGRADDRLRVFATASSLLSPKEIGVNYRFFHIDGGHNSDEALGDLRLAAACTISSGVIVVDDPFRADWPGVTEAIIRFLDSASEYAAVAVGFNKLLITRMGIAERYGRSFEDSHVRTEYGLGYPWSLKTLPFLSSPMRIFHIPSRARSRSLRARVEYLHRTRPWSRRPLPASVIGVARRLLA